MDTVALSSFHVLFSACKTKMCLLLSQKNKETKISLKICKQEFSIISHRIDRMSYLKCQVDYGTPLFSHLMMTCFIWNISQNSCCDLPGWGSPLCPQGATLSPIHRVLLVQSLLLTKSVPHILAAFMMICYFPDQPFGQLLSCGFCCLYSNVALHRCLPRMSTWTVSFID